MTRTNWKDRNHASHCSGRYGSAGWEFDTREQAIEYVNDQYSGIRQPEAAKDFVAEVRSNGVRTRYCAYGLVHTTTYRKPVGGTMRDVEIVKSPSDCTWMVPGSDAAAYCDYYR